MPFNGSGTWSNAGTSFSTPVTGTTISATAAQTFFSDLASNGLSACITKSGQTTVTANIPMSGFKFTGLAAGSANGDSLRYEQGVQALLTTTGDQMQASAANTPARLPAAATVAAHATTMNPWVARIVTLSGGAVTFTDIADAAFVGQEVWLVMNAAHVWTDGAVFDVQGGANYTCTAGDIILLTATAVDAFDVTIFKADGTAVVGTTTTTGTTSSTFTFNGSGGTTGSITLTYQKIGNWVTLNIPAVSGTSGTSSTSLTANTAIPAAYRPASTQDVICVQIRDNSVAVNVVGLVRVTTGGLVTVLKDGAGSAWTNSSSCGTQSNTSITYFIG